MLIDYASTDISLYKLMSQSIIPRPIAWIVTENEGVLNIAPFSYFTGLSSNPPTMIVSVGHKSDGTPKDTLANLRKHKKCTLCMVFEDHLEPMHLSSQELEHTKSEAETFDISTEKVLEDFPPMIKDVPVAFFCELFDEISLGQSKTIPLILEIKQQFIDDRVITDTEKMGIDFDPVARVGRSYKFLGETATPPK